MFYVGVSFTLVAFNSCSNCWFVCCCSRKALWVTWFLSISALQSLCRLAISVFSVGITSFTSFCAWASLVYLQRPICKQNQYMPSWSSKLPLWMLSADAFNTKYMDVFKSSFLAVLSSVYRQAGQTIKKHNLAGSSTLPAAAICSP